MVCKVTGYKIINKDDKKLCLMSIVRDARKESGEVGFIAESHFLPPYCIDSVSSYLGKLCSVNFRKYNDKYTVYSVDVVDTSALDNV